MKTRPNFMRAMEQAKRNAMHLRNKGRHVGASAEGWNRKPLALDRDSFHDAFRVAWNEWQSAKADAINDFQVAMLNGPNAETDIPF